MNIRAILAITSIAAAGLFGCADQADIPSETEPLGEQAEDLSVRICAGPLDLTCSPNQYCSSAYPGLCPSSDQIGACAARPRACTREYVPVCGCDGKTYGNACTAAAAGVAVAAQGECPKPGACKSDESCAKAEFCSFPEGQCAPLGTCAPRPRICPLIFRPVCGCDGNTYSNSCEASAAGVSVDHQGECRSGTFCGGIAGIPCPEGEQCVDDPSDDCDPKNGGADCGGICVCPTNPCAAVLCSVGTQCVADGCRASCEPIGGDDGCGGCPAGQYCCDPLNDRCVPVGNLCAL